VSKPIKLLIVAGARPNFMKVAPIIRAIRTRPPAATPSFEYRLVHTGQHYDAKMSDVFFQELGIPAPDHNLEVGSGSHAVQTAQVMLKFEPVVLAERPDWVVVVGDVNSTVACTLVATKLGVRVAHVEAGLRSFDRGMPEEINRLVTDAISDLLLTPSDDGDQHLRREGVAEHKIRQVGNIMIDCLTANLDQARKSQILSTHGIQPGNFVYMTLHRPSNVDHQETLTSIFKSLEAISRTVPVVFPVHPRTRKMIQTFGIDIEKMPGLRLIEPVGYLDSVALTENARLVLTDSGGLQEEATYFRTPCLTLRPNTERPITITIGSNKLTTAQALFADATEILSGPRRRGDCPRLWDGKTAERVLEALSLGAQS
jgi:UDP-N-acetylglucosamine 2-epimerase (non-hydrolysing)